jgi:1,5-anhydro-D-fructose reductase (1,5-anhydro-D-mannitol-forming)
MQFIHGPVHWGIIGCGDVCEIKSGPAFSKIPNSSLVAVMRRDAAKAKDYASRHGVPKFYTDAQQLINDPEINAIYVATPPAQHEEYAIQSMQAGKPVYVEKPIALHAAACSRMIEASKKHEIPVSGAYYRRELPLFNKVKSLLQEGTVGKVKLATIRTFQSPTKNTVTSTPDQWRVNPALSGGGLFHDLAPHQLDLMYWFFGKPIETKGRSLHQDMQAAPDLTNLEVIFDNQILLQGTWAFNLHESAFEDSCQIMGDKGMLKFSFFKGATLEISTDQGDEKIDFTNPLHIQQPMIEKVVKYFQGEQGNPCSLEDALVSMKMLDSANGK